MALSPLFAKVNIAKRNFWMNEPTELPPEWTCPKCSDVFDDKCRKHECDYYIWCLDQYLDSRVMKAQLRKVELAAKQVLDECAPDSPPSLGSLAVLADCLHSTWKCRQDRQPELTDSFEQVDFARLALAFNVSIEQVHKAIEHTGYLFRRKAV